MDCPHCGKEHPETERICPNTGLPLGQSMICPVCSQEARPGARFCAACGAALPRTQLPVQVRFSSNKKENDDSATASDKPSPHTNAPIIDEGVTKKTDPTIPVGSQGHSHPAASPVEPTHPTTPPSWTAVPTSPRAAEQSARQSLVSHLLGYGLLILLVVAGVMGLLSLWSQLRPRPAAVASATATPPAVAALTTHTLPPTATNILPAQILASATPQQTLAPPTKSPRPTVSSPVPPLPVLSLTPTNSGLNHRLAFYSSRDEQPGIYVMDTENPHDLFAIPLPEGYEVAAWPGFCGEQLVYEVQDRALELPRWIYRYDLIDHSSQPVDLGDLEPLRISAPACSLDGRYLAFSAYLDGGWELLVIHLDTGEIVYRYKTPEYPVLGHAAWSQDSDTLWWMGTRINGFYDINLVQNYQNGSTRQIRTFAKGKYPAISPDGSRLAFFCGNLLYLCVAQVPSGEILFQLPISYFKLVNDLPVPATASWSYDGRWLYFPSSVTGNWDIYRVRADGSQVQNLTEAWRTDEYMPSAR